MSNYATKAQMIEIMSDAATKIDTKLATKVDAEAGKGLSSNDYTSEEKLKLSSLENYDDTDIKSSLGDKVDKVTGKGLSTNDYTTEEKVKLAGLENYDDTEIKADIEDKVDKVTGKGLSTNDYTDAEKMKLQNLENYDDTEVRTSIGNKVDKVAGKGLSANDYTDAEKEKLEGLSNYDDSSVREAIGGKLDSNKVGVANGVASLDASGKVPASELPSYVDDVVEGYYDPEYGKFYKDEEGETEIVGETGKIYVDLYTDKTYRWSGTVFANISSSLALGRTSSTAFPGDAGKDLEDTIDNKVDKITGKGLSANDYTDEDKAKLEAISDFTTSDVADVKNAFSLA